MSIRKYEVTDALKEWTHNAGCRGVADELLFVVSNMTAHERGKLAGLLGRFGFVQQTQTVLSTSEHRAADEKGDQA